MNTMNDLYKPRHSLILLMAASFLAACSHTGEVHHANMYMTNPDADIETEELMEETNFTSIR
jgi:outer membrane biogenesis lipoprotein LolB